MKAKYWHVQTPEMVEQEISMTFIGTIKSSRPGYVWLCSPGGNKIMEVPNHCVKRSSREECAKRLEFDALHNKRGMN